MIKQRIIHEELVVNSQLRRRNGSCPIMPEEVRLLHIAHGTYENVKRTLHIILFVGGNLLFIVIVLHVSV